MARSPDVLFCRNTGTLESADKSRIFTSLSFFWTVEPVRLIDLVVSYGLIAVVESTEVRIALEEHKSAAVPVVGDTMVFEATVPAASQGHRGRR